MRVEDEQVQTITYRKAKQQVLLYNKESYTQHPIINCSGK